MKKIFLTFGLATTLFVACSKSDNDQPQPDNGKKPVVEELILPKKIVEKINDTIVEVNTYTFDGKKIVSSTFQEYEDGAPKSTPSVTTYTYQGDYIIKDVSVGGRNDSTTEYTYENGKLVKTEMIEEGLTGLSETFTYAYSGDKLSKKVRAYYRNREKNTIIYSECTYTYNGNVVTEIEEKYRIVNNGNKENVTKSTTVYTIQNGNLIKKEENEGEYTYISEYTYDTNKNPYADFALALNPDYFIELQFTTNNVLTELVSKKDNDTGAVTIEKKATSTYQYNAQGYPTKEETINTEGIYAAKLTIEYEY